MTNGAHDRIDEIEQERRGSMRMIEFLSRRLDAAMSILTRVSPHVEWNVVIDKMVREDGNRCTQCGNIKPLNERNVCINCQTNGW